VNNDEIEPRRQQREKKLKKKKERQPKHGKGLAKTYRDAVLKRARGK
jgi:hypothetical protein